MFCNKNIPLARCYVKNVSGPTAMSFLSETNIKKAFEWNLCCLRSKKVRDAVLRQCRKQLNEHSQRGERSGWPCEWWSLQYTVDDKFMKTNHLNSLTDKTSYILDGIWNSALILLTWTALIKQWTLPVLSCFSHKISHDSHVYPSGMLG